MARHTTYRIGGPAHAYAQVNSIAALATVLKVCADEELSWFVSGKGSNLLVSDEGYPGVVIALAGEFRAWQFDEEEGTVVVGAVPCFPAWCRRPSTMAFLEWNLPWERQVR